MKLRELGEFAFIDRITPGCDTGEPTHVTRGIGDDAAVVRGTTDPLVITTDMLIERIHFVRGTISFAQLGYKSLAVNLSDISAMGAAPLDAFLSIAVPPSVTVEQLDQFYDGMKRLASAAGVNLLGGDTTGSKQDLCINVAVTGTAPENEILYRSGARVGDRILVSGTLGDSAGGLEILLGRAAADPTVRAPLLAAHYEPELYLEEARIIASSGWAGAAIDLSDGLASDLGHVCRASGVGAVVERDAIPMSEALLTVCRDNALDPIKLAVGGGEDYRLLVTVDPEGVDPITERIAERTGRRFVDIGEITEGAAVRVRGSDGVTVDLAETGWDHFKTPQPNTDGRRP